MENEKRTAAEILKEIENLRDSLVKRAVQERKNVIAHGHEAYLNGLETGYASCYELVSEYLDDIINNKP